MMSKLDSDNPKAMGSETTSGNIFYIRFANRSDIPAICTLFANHANNNLHPRSPKFFRKMIDRSFAVIMEEDKNSTCANNRGGEGLIVAYAEICFLSSREEIEYFFADVVKMKCNLIPFLPGDIFIYLGGALKDASFKGASNWSEKATSFAAAHCWDREKDHESRRIVIVYGLASGTSGEYNNNKGHREMCLENSCRKLTPNRKMTCKRVFAHLMPETTNILGDPKIMGNVLYRMYDKPLTAHQLERTKRNRYLITETEQQRLLGCRIGIVGLSTGSVALDALLRQGVGGIYRLADFDNFEVSNGNRMLFDKKDVGQSKLQLCRERVMSTDFDIIVEGFPDGLSSNNVSSFVRDCDIIIEECDDFLIKFLVRKEAVKYRRPVLMATSQNGMIDIERYDIDEAAKPFHVDDFEELSQLIMKPNLSVEEAKAQLVPKIYDIRLISDRFQESAKEIGKSISSWPQLSEEVFLNAATLTHVTRRILLGDTKIISGRFSFDMNSMFTAKNKISTSSITAPFSRL